MTFHGTQWKKSSQIMHRHKTKSSHVTYQALETPENALASKIRYGIYKTMATHLGWEKLLYFPSLKKNLNVLAPLLQFKND